jgi:hypothetical protein
MKLMTKELLKKLPDLYSTEEIPLLDKVAVCKFFTPDSNWTWLICEAREEEDDLLMWGLVLGFEQEFGYVSLNELESCHGPLGMKIERDLHFRPRTIRECANEGVDIGRFDS